MPRTPPLQPSSCLKALCAAVALCLCAGPALAQAPACAADAIEQALKLLRFHTEAGPQAQVDEVARPLPPVTNPANRRQQFAVLEVKGWVHKANYRLRLLYYPLDKQCLLMGQEVLELSSP